MRTMRTISTTTDRDEQDREADHFAMCLLIPEEAIRELFPIPIQGSWIQHEALELLL